MRLLFVAIFTIAVASVYGKNQAFEDNGSVIDPQGSQMLKLVIGIRPFTEERYTQDPPKVPSNVIIRIDDLKFAISPDNGNRSDAKLVFVNGRHDGIYNRLRWGTSYPPPSAPPLSRPESSGVENSKDQKESKTEYEIIDLRSLT